MVSIGQVEEMKVHVLSTGVKLNIN